uniref:Uncharacterized protein n=1 Tax=Zea mays TaxID=4577 RepID=C0P9W6_MAIZE|nr:unknown [Zea mays]
MFFGCRHRAIQSQSFKVHSTGSEITTRPGNFRSSPNSGSYLCLQTSSSHFFLPQLLLYCLLPCLLCKIRPRILILSRINF